MAAILNFSSQTTSGNVRGDRDVVKLGMVDNMGIAVGIASPSLAVQKLFPLPVFVGRHLELLWSAIVYQRRSASGSVPSVKSKSGVVENVGVAVGIMSVCCWKPKLHRPAKNRRFFHGGCPLFSTSLQVLERAIVTRKTR